MVIVLLLGALNVFAFAPFGFWPLQIACLTMLFILIMQAPSAGAAALLGWLYSFSWTCAGVYWLYISLHNLGGMPGWLAILAIALLALGLGLIVGAATGAARWLEARWRTSRVITLLVILPTLWMLSEWTRSWIFTGFPWLSSGLAHTDSPLAGYAPLVGVYGISWVVAAVAAAVAAATQFHSAKARLAPGVLVVLLFGGGQALRGLDWTAPHGNPISVRLLQGNIAQEMKFDYEQLAPTLGLYQTMITAQPADLIVTPETAVPVPRQQLPPDYLQGLTLYAKHSGSHVLVGMPVSDDPAHYSNGLIVIDPEPRAPAKLPVPIAQVTPPYRYDKHHLVPFGEFIPSGFRWFVDFMHMPLGDQTSGAALQPPFLVRDQWILPNICYEDLFGEEIAAQLRERAGQGAPLPTFLLNISNIAWFGDSIAVPQHLQISRMRSLETGRPMLRATNTGATAVIGPHGQVEAQLAPFTRGTLAASVQGYAGLTPYIRFGNAAIVTLAVSILLWLAVVAHRQRRTRSGIPVIRV
ncbi:MAG: apolipoprotein N-acyltransferase [Burkholderiaceae bacterium]